jgi:hypothetical protein
MAILENGFPMFGKVNEDVPMVNHSLLVVILISSKLSIATLSGKICSNAWKTGGIHGAEHRATFCVGEKGSGRNGTTLS